MKQRKASYGVQTIGFPRTFKLVLTITGQQVLEKQLLAQPHRNGHAEGFKATRCQGNIGFQQTLELQKGLVVEGDDINVGSLNTGFLQAILDGLPGEARIVLLAGKAFFLGGGNDLAVTQQGGGAVVIEGGDAENDHGLEQGIDEGCNGATLCHDDEASEDDHHDEDGDQPIFLAGAHERPEFLEQGHKHFLELIIE